MKTKILNHVLVMFLVSLAYGSCTKSDETTVKEAYRNAQDEMCKMVNGKLECAAKSIKNEVKDLTN